jgi:hypothetical protein
MWEPQPLATLRASAACTGKILPYHEFNRHRSIIKDHFPNFKINVSLSPQIFLWVGLSIFIAQQEVKLPLPSKYAKETLSIVFRNKPHSGLFNTANISPHTYINKINYSFIILKKSTSILCPQKHL